MILVISLFPKRWAKEVTLTNDTKKDKWASPLPLSVAQVITINDNDYLNFSQLTSFMFSKTQAKDDALNLKFWQVKYSNQYH